MKILLLSAYDAASHRYWHQGLVAQFPQYQWTVLTLPARYFAWRLRGNSLSWGFGQRDLLEQDYDLVVATSMTDLSALRGFVTKLGSIPTLVYFHENQFAYPKSGREFESVEPQLLNLYTALAADRVLFNTHFNRDTFLNGCAKLLKKLPDQIPPNLLEQLKARSAVLPVPLPEAVFQTSSSKPGPLEIVWNHRWEFDKGPDLLLAALRQLAKQVSPNHWRLHLVGQQFRQSPKAFEQIKAEFAEQIASWGFVESAQAYRQILAQSDLVLSTALHDFQGIAVLEGVAAGCLPLVPQRLAYPELFGTDYCYAGKDEDEAAQLALRLGELVALKQQGLLPKPPSVASLSWQTLRPSYQKALESLI